MDDISDLLKEAKPLYFARKRRRNQIKATLGMLVCVVMMSSLWPQKYGSYTLLPDTEFENQLALIEDGSVIEDMGLPVDDYGLLMVG
ncbi:MAG: hypothetical protein OSJ76_07950 [Alphaproteobacteria bacterium]|nr:hypothetical protein [Alphaproteobacteria bacterium]